MRFVNNYLCFVQIPPTAENHAILAKIHFQYRGMNKIIYSYITYARKTEISNYEKSCKSEKTRFLGFFIYLKKGKQMLPFFKSDST